jgi:toxin ParE1/3/4
VARIEFAPEILEDFERFFDHMAQFEIEDQESRIIEDQESRIGEIVQAIQILTHSPLIGHPVRGGRRELVIGRGSHGYVALYRFVARIDTAFVLAIRIQHELSYQPEH